MGSAPLLRLLVALVLGSALSAQDKAPFRGRVLDDNGAPIARAEVTCSCSPDPDSLLGLTDRATGVTDSDGRFALDLAIGNAYVVWAIGPPDGNGSSAIVRPIEEGAGGKQLDLIADERRNRSMLKLTGTGGWLCDGPLALRILVAGNHQVGRDLPIPGDGALHLPTLPASHITVQLVDGKGRVLETRTFDLDPKTELLFSPPSTVPVLAIDENGHPLAGVQILQADRSVVAITGADGTAVARITSQRESQWLFGHLAGHADCMSGWVRGQRIHDSALDDGDEDGAPLLFLLHDAAPATLRVLGLYNGERAAVRFHCWFPVRLDRGNPTANFAFPASAAGDQFTADGPPGDRDISASVQVCGAGPVPRRILARSSGRGPSLPNVDLDSLRRFEVAVEDAAGRPVPCAHLDVAVHSHAVPIPWQVRFVTDAAGRAELLACASCDWDVYASTLDQLALRVLRPTDPAATLRLTLQPMPLAQLRIVDRAGQPVDGAWCKRTGSRIGNRMPSLTGRATERIAFELAGARAALRRSNAMGELNVPIVPCDGFTVLAKAFADGRWSDEFELQADGAVRTIVLH